MSTRSRQADARVAHTLRALAWLLRYPDAEQRQALGELEQALAAEGALAAARRAELRALVARLRASRPLTVESDYVDTFDRSRRCSLHLFEHIHGDSRERGPAMIDLARTYESAGLCMAPGELPDYLPVALEYASTQPAPLAREFLLEIAQVVRAIFSALLERASPYASVLAAVLELAGERAEAVPVEAEPALDASWEEPEAFSGCASRGQARPAQQPIQFVARAADRRVA